jgi:DNA-binding CsgD family transcriptional regulator
MIYPKKRMEYSPICVECLSRSCEHVVARPLCLTSSQQEVIRALSDGLRNKEIAALLGITEGTVKVYLVHVFRILKLKSRLEVALWGRDHAELLSEVSLAHAKERRDPSNLSPEVSDAELDRKALIMMGRDKGVKR